MKANYTTPMREPKVNRYEVNRKDQLWDLNTLVERKPLVVENNLLGEIDLKDYQILSYQSGNALIKGENLKFNHFDTVQPLIVSKHPIKDEWTTTFIAYRNEQSTILITEKIK